MQLLYAMNVIYVLFLLQNASHWEINVKSQKMNNKKKTAIPKIKYFVWKIGVAVTRTTTMTSQFD